MECNFVMCTTPLQLGRIIV